MDAPVTRQARPTTPADLHRLAAVAQTRGLRLTQGRAGVWFCSSASRPEPHYVTRLSCDCRGFQEHQRCTHYALLLDHLGWLPAMETEDAPAPTPEPVPVLQYGNCSGGGVVYVKACERAGWPHPTCPDCQGAGELPAVPVPDPLTAIAA